MTTNKKSLIALLAVLGVVLAAQALAAVPQTYR